MISKVACWGGGDVWRVVSGAFPSNAYICTTDVPGGCVLVDGGLDPLAIDAAMQELGVRPHSVFCTHGHFDHVGSAAHFQRKDGATVYLHEADARTMKSSNFLLHAFRIDVKVDLPNAVLVKSGQAVNVGAEQIVFHSTPGHTPGSCVLELGSSLFTGDTIYASTVGLSKLPGEDLALLRKSIHAALPLLTAERTVHPGHGRSCSGAEVRTGNRALIEFLEEDE